MNSHELEEALVEALSYILAHRRLVSNHDADPDDEAGAILSMGREALWNLREYERMKAEEEAL